VPLREPRPEALRGAVARSTSDCKHVARAVRSR
jgi:hypothetical protein